MGKRFLKNIDHSLQMIRQIVSLGFFSGLSRCSTDNALEPPIWHYPTSFDPPLDPTLVRQWDIDSWRIRPSFSIAAILQSSHDDRCLPNDLGRTSAETRCFQLETRVNSPRLLLPRVHEAEHHLVPRILLHRINITVTQETSVLIALFRTGRRIEQTTSVVWPHWSQLCSVCWIQHRRRRPHLRISHKPHIRIT